MLHVSLEMYLVLKSAVCKCMQSLSLKKVKAKQNLYVVSDQRLQPSLLKLKK